ncbi:hypothetical protein [Erwinia aphidicola]|uniref:hypothetical protein n=1 Tax=Erwinia aphidicola TaxID=68334 RepID=UPI0030CEBE2D
MTEIKRYDVVLVDGVPAHRPSEQGRWVKHGDLAELQDQLQRYSMSAGQVDQRKSESDAVRVALGFSADADDVAPCDLVDAIAALQEQLGNDLLAQELRKKPPASAQESSHEHATVENSGSAGNTLAVEVVHKQQSQPLEQRCQRQGWRCYQRV